MIMTAIPTNNPIILKPAIRRDVSDVDHLRVVERDRDIRDSQNPCSSLLDGVLCSSLLASSELGDRHWRDQQKKRWLAWWVLKHQKLVDVAVCLRTLKRSLWEMMDICNFWLRIYVDESIHYWCAASILLLSFSALGWDHQFLMYEEDLCRFVEGALEKHFDDLFVWFTGILSEFRECINGCEQMVPDRPSDQ